MPVANVTSEWVDGNLVFKNANDGTTLLTINSSTGLNSDVVGDVTGNLTGQTFGTVTTYTAATPAIALTDKEAKLDATSNGVAATLAAGTAGQVIYVKAINVDNAVTLVPASFTDGTTITFTPVDEYVVLISDGTNWDLVGGNAAVT